MNGFINHIIDRHLPAASDPVGSPANAVIQPRLPGRFESRSIPGNAFAGSETSVAVEASADPVAPVHNNRERVSTVQAGSKLSLTPADTVTPSYLREPAAPAALPAMIIREARLVRDVPVEGSPVGDTRPLFPGAAPEREFPAKNKEEAPASPALSVIRPRLPEEAAGDRSDKGIRQPVQAAVTGNVLSELARLRSPEPERPLAPPPVQVFIGRIEVRAIASSGAAKAPRQPAPRPRMSLDDYLNKRNNTSL